MRRAIVPTVLAAALLLAPGALAAEVTVSMQCTLRGEPLDDPTRGKFYVFELEQEENYVAWGDGTRSVRVPAGTYRLVVRYVNDVILRERVFEEVDLSRDLEHTVDFDVSIAGLTLWVTSGGFPVPRFAGRYSLYRAGQRGKPLVSRRPGEPVTIEPGVYDIEVAYRGADGLKSKWIERYDLQGQRQETVDVGTSLARLRVTLLDRGRPLGPDAGVWRAYRAGDRERPVAEGRSGEGAVLDAGTYDVGLFYLREGERGERWLRGVQVSGTLERQVDVGAESDRLTVLVRNGGREVADAWCGVYAPGERAAPLGSGRSGEAIELRPGTYDVGCFLRRGGVRASRWIEGRALEGPTELELDLGFEEASLRVRPPRGKSREVAGASNLLLVVDSSAAMGQRLDAKSRLEHVQSSLLPAVDTLIGTEANVGLRVFGITPREQRDCGDTTLLAPVEGYDRSALDRALRLLRPTGQAPIARSLERAAADLPAGGVGSVLLITAGEDSCGADVCAAAARLVRDGGVSRIYAVALGAPREARPGLDCVGEYRAARSELELQAALREVLREVRRREEGSVTVFLPGWSEIVASSTLLERIRLAAGSYDVLIRAGEEIFRQEGVEVRGNLEFVAGEAPARSR